MRFPCFKIYADISAYAGLGLKQHLGRDTSEQLKQGVRKFCERYKMMTAQNFSDNRIASALNRFGWVFGGTVTSVQGGLLRRGRRIAVQATAAGRRRKTLSRGKSKAPSGRPLKKEAQTISEYNIRKIFCSDKMAYHK